jgi:hypothetical protein
MTEKVLRTFEVQAHEPSRYICWVGYDKGVRSFFVYVAGRPVVDKGGRVGQSNHVVIWFGTHEREITKVARVKELLAPYAELPAVVETSLRAAQGTSGEREEQLASVSGQ